VITTPPADRAIDPPVPTTRARHLAIMLRLAVPYVALTILKRVVPLPRLVKWAWLRPHGPRDRDAEALTIRCLVRLRRLTFADRGDCVQGSLVLYRALSRVGASPHFVVGLHRIAGNLRGHAWITVDGKVVAEAETSVASFTPTMEFGANGSLLSRADRAAAAQ
jgi:hypothetical protein